MLKQMKLVLVSALAVIGGIVAYSQKGNAEREARTLQEMKYEVIVKLTNAKITEIVVKEGDNEQIISDYSETSWNRSFSGDLPVRISAKGQASQGNDSTAKMTIEVLKEGVPYRNAVAQGANLEANVSF